MKTLSTSANKLKRNTTIFITLFLIIGLGMLSVGGYEAQISYNLVNMGNRTTGTVTETRIEKYTRKGKPRTRVVANIVFKNQIEIPNTFEVKENFSVNDTVNVIYLKGSEHEAKIDTFEALWMTPLIFSLGGLAFVGISIGVLLFRKKRNKQINWLNTYGRKIEAKVTNIKMNSGTGKRRNQKTFQLELAWQDPISGKTHNFESELLADAPSPDVVGKSFSVTFKSDEPEVYYVKI
jgi:hypothetical protein